MHYVSAGAGAPALVFVHGFTCDHTDWKSQLEALQRHHEVVACDLRGHGATPGRPEECSIGHYGGDVAALIANLEFRRAVLVGHSMGCRVVLEAARLDPSRIAGVALIDGSRQGTGDPETAAANARAMMSGEGFMASFFAQMFLRPSAESAAIVERAKRLRPEIGLALFGAMARWDAGQMEAALAALRAPLLVIQTTRMNAQRQRTPLKAGETSPWLDLVRSRVPGARIEVLPGLGHFAQLEAPGEVNRLLATFAAGCR